MGAIEIFINIHSDPYNKFILYSNHTLKNTITNKILKQPLSKILYITKNGIEEEYDLQIVFNEAVITRENYCQNLISAAYALQECYCDDDDDSSTIATKDTFYKQHLTDNSITDGKKHNLRTIGIQTDNDVITSTNKQINNTIHHHETNKNDINNMEPKSYFGKPTSFLDEMISNFIFTTFRGFLLFLKIIFIYLPKYMMKSILYCNIVFFTIGIFWFCFANDNGAYKMMIDGGSSSGYYMGMDRV